MREIITARLLRGQTIRTRADVMRTERIHERSLIIAWALALCWWTGWITVMAAWITAYVPTLGVALAAAVSGLLLGGGWGFLAAALSLALAGRLWSRRWPVTWHRWVTGRVRRFWRRIRYRWSWDDVCAASTVKATDASHRVIVPRLLWVRLSEHVDELHVQLCAGVTPGTIARQADVLACEWCALEVRVMGHPRHEGWVLLRVIYRDVLADDPAECEPQIDFSAVEIGRREDGQPWRLRLIYTHILIAGLTGAGKSGLVARIIKALAPAIGEGRVRLIGIDPKGGMEYAMCSPLFYMLAYGSETVIVAALEAAAGLMAEREAELRGRVRKLTDLIRLDRRAPTPEHPLYIVLVDELLAVISFITDRQLRERATAALNRLLTQGRAPGFVVIGCVQDPRKEVLPMRDRFGYRVGQRLDSDTEVRMVLSDTAYERGAHCDLIPESCPGMAYVVDEDGGKRQPFKVRNDWVSDAELGLLAATYPAPVQVEVPALTDPKKRGPGLTSGGQAA